MSDIVDDLKASGTTRIVGRDEVYAADVILEDGIYKLATSKKVEVDSLSGKQDTATNYFEFKAVALNDTLRIEIDATPLTPLLDKTFTVLGGEDQYDFAARVVLELNQNFVDFQPYFKATQVKDNSIIFIESKIVGEAGENVTQNSFRITGTGTITNFLQRAFDNWERRTSIVQASKSARDPRLAVFGIEGTVESRSADVKGLFVIQPYRNGNPTLINMNIDPVGNQVFTFPMDVLDDIFISEIRFFALDSNISFGKFLGRNFTATGIKIDIKTDNNTITLPLIRNTEDFADLFSFGGGDNFSLYIQSGADKMLASFLSSPFALRRKDTFGIGNDDYIRITIQDADNFSSVTKLQAVIVGYKREA